MNRFQLILETAGIAGYSVNSTGLEVQTRSYIPLLFWAHHVKFLCLCFLTKNKNDAFPNKHNWNIIFFFLQRESSVSTCLSPTHHACHPLYILIPLLIRLFFLQLNKALHSNCSKQFQSHKQCSQPRKVSYLLLTTGNIVCTNAISDGKARLQLFVLWRACPC